MCDSSALADALREFYIRSHRVMDRALHSKGVSLARIKLLAYIVRQGQPRSTDIAEAFGFAPRTVTEAIDGLEREGLVRRDADPLDRRAKRISLTPAGHAAIAASEPVRKAMLLELFGVLDEAEQAQMTALVGRLVDRLGELDGSNLG